jgi:hypothetical protein
MMIDTLQQTQPYIEEEQTTQWPKDTTGVIRNRISKKNRQHNGQKKKYKRKNNDLQNIHIKLEGPAIFGNFLQ